MIDNYQVQLVLNDHQLKMIQMQQYPVSELDLPNLRAGGSSSQIY